MVFKALKVEVINVYREVWKWSAAILELSVKRSRGWGRTSKGHWQGAICEVRGKSVALLSWKPSWSSMYYMTMLNIYFVFFIIKSFYGSQNLHEKLH